MNRIRSEQVIPWLIAALILGFNFYLCHELFGLDFSVQMGSIEGSYITIGRWILMNWRDLTWFPLWYNGEAFHSVYQPGLHAAVAALAGAGHLTPQHAYHLLTGITYSLVPLGLFALCYATTGRWSFALASALLYSLVSPVCFFSPLSRLDAGGLLWPRRYQILVHYGEGPHTTAVAMIPLVILSLHAALYGRRRLWLVLAPVAMAAVIITNWPGSVGMTMAILAYAISQVGALERIQFGWLIGFGALAYMVVSPWIPPTVILAVLSNAQQSDGTSLGSRQLVPVMALTLALCALHLLFRRLKVDRTFRFFVFFATISGIAALGGEWFGWRLLPQATRFQVEFDLASAAVAGWFIEAGVRALSPRLRLVAAIGLLVLVVPQARLLRRYAREQSRPIDISSTIEYQMARAFEEKMHGQRVFAPGNVSLWMNLFSDVPQMAGCCDQGVPGFEYRVASYAIYTGQNAGSRDAEVSLLWLRAYGANAIGTTGPHSTEAYRPFWNWRKFDGVLPELWRKGENVIYKIPRKSADPVRVIPKSSLLQKAPENGLDVEGLQHFVGALENPATGQATFRWLNRHEALIEADITPGDLVYLQIGKDKGWHAEEGGTVLPVLQDVMGMMYVEPAQTGHVQMRLIYDGGVDATFARVLQAAAVIAMLLIFFQPRIAGRL